MNEPTTEYQKTIATVIAARHRVEWKPLHASTSFAVLHIDGVPCGSDLTGDRPVVAGVWCESGSAWAKRRLSADPRKAAAVLIDRHRTLIAAREHSKAVQAAADRRDAKRKALTAAFGDVPGLLVDVHPALAIVSFRAYDLTPEKAARLGDAIREILDGVTAEDREREAEERDGAWMLPTDTGCK